MKLMLGVVRIMSLIYVELQVSRKRHSFVHSFWDDKDWSKKHPAWAFLERMGQAQNKENGYMRRRYSDECDSKALRPQSKHLLLRSKTAEEFFNIPKQGREVIYQPRWIVNDIKNHLVFCSKSLDELLATLLIKVICSCSQESSIATMLWTRRSSPWQV